MSTWAQRAKAHFSQERQNSTVKTTERVCVFSQERQKHTTETTETPLSVVLTVQSEGFCEKRNFEKLTESAASDDLDDRVRCTDCRNLWKASYCVTHRAAGLTCRDLAQEFTLLKQRCPAFTPMARAQAP